MWRVPHGREDTLEPGDLGGAETVNRDPPSIARGSGARPAACAVETRNPWHPNRAARAGVLATSTASFE